MCNPAAVTAAEELHARNKGYSTWGRGVGKTVTLLLQTMKRDSAAHLCPAGESMVALTVCHAPQIDCLLPRPSDELPRIRLVELEAGDGRAAIFSNVSFTGNCSTPLPLAAMTLPPRPSSFRAAAMVNDLDVLNTSCCTETLSPGLQVRAA